MSDFSEDAENGVKGELNQPSTTPAATYEALKWRAPRLARDLLKRGFKPIPERPDNRAPLLGDQWHKVEITEKVLDKHFCRYSDLNVAAQLGPASNKLTDFDADCAIARTLAPRFMPKTGMIFGRASARSAHYEYYSDLCDTRNEDAIRFSDPVEASFDAALGDHKNMILELRIGGGGKGAKTTFPGSIHYLTHELIEYEPGCDGEPARVDGKGLLRAASLCATACLLARHCKELTIDAGRAIGDLFAGCKASVSEARQVAEAICAYRNNDTSQGTGFVTAVASAHASHTSDIGNPLAKLLNLKLKDARQVVERIALWLGAMMERGGDEGADDSYGRTSRGGIDQHIASMNEQFALVILHNGHAFLKHDEIDEHGRPALTLWSADTFMEWHADRYVVRNEKRIKLGDYWRRHAQRLKYKGIVFAPGRERKGYYNLFRGFPIAPAAEGEGDYPTFRDHLLNNVCGGDKTFYNWVFGWFASIFQHPDEKEGTAVVLRGDEGVGKTIVGEIFGHLLHPHYRLVDSPRQVTGNFNAHMASILLLQADEAFWAGDHAAEGKLKSLVTSLTLPIEFKGKDTFYVDNYVRLFITGNKDWLVPAGYGARRWAVFDIAETRKDDHTYFKKMRAEMDQGGYGALMRDMLSFDLTTINLRSVPKTQALLDQKILSLDAERKWWLDVLRQGELPWGAHRYGKQFCPVKALTDAYVNHAKRQGAPRRSTETMLGTFLNAHAPGLKKKWRDYDVRGLLGGDTTRRGYVYEFPSLAVCRKEFVKKIGQDVSWDEDNDWRAQIKLDEGSNEDVPF